MKMRTKLTFTTLLLAFTILAFGQSEKIIVPANVNLPKDTLITNLLINSLNGFLALKEKPNNENTYVSNKDLLEMSILLDEMKGIEKDKKSNNFYKGYLTAVTQLEKKNYLIQFSYIGISENIPTLRASFEILGQQKDNQFYFSSPLKRNTSTWKAKKIGTSTFHYKNRLNEKIVKEYLMDLALFDKKLNAKETKIEWYGCDDLPELLQNIGLTFKLDYNGIKSGVFNAIENNTLLLVNGSNNSCFDTFDPHDLFHERARNVIPADKINASMVCGCAYIYGGSWGISYENILKTFKEKVSSNPNSDWLKLYTEAYNFGESQGKHLLVTQMVNALIIKKTEKEKGFSSVIELLSSGNFRKDSDGFFRVLEKVTGINKTNFNEKVWELIRHEK